MRFSGASGWLPPLILLAAQSESNLEELRDRISSVAISLDGRQLATGDFDGTIRLWDAGGRKQTRRIKASDGAVRGLSFSPDGKTLASAGENGIRLWNAASGDEIRHLPLKRAATCVAFHPQGKLLAAGSDNSLRIVPPESMEVISTLQAHEGRVTAVAFFPNGEWMASAGHDGFVRLWSVAPAKQIAELKGQGAPINCIAVSSCGYLIASGDSNGQVCLWESKTGKLITRVKTSPKEINGLVFLPGPIHALASLGNDGILRAWDLLDLESDPIMRDMGSPLYSGAVSKNLALFTGGSGVRIIEGRHLVSRKTPDPKAIDLKESWSSLASTDARVAHRAMADLVKAASLTPDYLKQVLIVDSAKAEKLIEQLDDDDPRIREEALKSLYALGFAIVPVARNSLKRDTGSTEVKTQLKSLISSLEDPRSLVTSPGSLQRLRSIQVLEWIGDAAGRELLQSLCNSPTCPLERDEAQRALDRLKLR